MRHEIPLLLLGALLWSGCANYHSIHRKDRLPGTDASVVFTDAKQRAILASPKTTTTDGKVEELLRFCSEPPPDVFSALATSLGADLGKGAGGHELSAKLSVAISENAATIKRTQTINILRESMFRTCERYLSGAIGETEFIVQAARDQRAMVAVLAIEQLTGVQEAVATALTTSAKTHTGQMSNESLAILDRAKTALDAATADAAEKKAAADVDCATAKESDDSAHAARKELCLAADRASDEQKKAADYYEIVKNGVEKLSSASSEASGAVRQLAESVSAPSDAIADTVARIVEDVRDFDELSMTCVVLFRLNVDQAAKFDAIDADLKKACIDMIQSRLAKDKSANELEAARTELRTLEIKQELGRQLQVLSGEAQKVWNHVVGASGVPDPAKLDALIASAGIAVPPSVRSALVTASSVDEFARVYPRLGPDNEKALAAAVP